MSLFKLLREQFAWRRSPSFRDDLYTMVQREHGFTQGALTPDSLFGCMSMDSRSRLCDEHQGHTEVRIQFHSDKNDRRMPLRRRPSFPRPDSPKRDVSNLRTRSLDSLAPSGELRDSFNDSTASDHTSGIGLCSGDGSRYKDLENAPVWAFGRFEGSGGWDNTAGMEN